MPLPNNQTVSVPYADWFTPVVNAGFYPTGYFVEAKQAMVVNYPRPDVETSTLAYHRNATSGVEMHIPIDVIFGAYPYVYEIVSAPVGATIGEIYGDVDYGILKFTPAADGAYSFDIKVTDQQLNTVNVTFSGTTGDSQVVYVDAVNGSDAAAGTFVAPWQTLEYARNNASGKPVGLKTGTYNVPLDGLATRLTQARAFFGVLGETVSISGANLTANRMFDWAESDGFVGNVRLFGMTNVQPSMRYFSTFENADRTAQFKIHFDGATVGSSGSDNPSCNFLGYANSTTTTTRSHATQVHCRFTDMPFSTNGFSAFDIYVTGFYSHQHNTYDGLLDARYGLWVKGNANADVFINDNAMANGADGYFVDLYFNENTQRAQVSYNKLISNSAAAPNVDNVALRLLGASIEDTSAVLGPIWCFRNTSYGEVQIVSAQTVVSGVDISFENDVIIHNITYAGATDKVMGFSANDNTSIRRNPFNITGVNLTVTGAECQGETTDGIVDVANDYRLTGSFLSFRGQRGHEIYKP